MCRIRDNLCSQVSGEEGGALTDEHRLPEALGEGGVGEAGLDLSGKVDPRGTDMPAQKRRGGRYRTAGGSGEQGVRRHRDAASGVARRALVVAEGEPVVGARLNAIKQ